MKLRLVGMNCLVMTPFTESGDDIDGDSLRNLIDYVIEGGAEGLVAIGRIGEHESLTMAERKEVMDITVDHVKGRVPVGFGIIDAKYDEGLEVGRLGQEAGGEFVMSRPPTDGDLFQYYRDLSNIIPVMMYDQGIHGSVPVDTVIAPLVKECENIIGVKSSAVPTRMLELKRLVDVPCLCGWDMMSMLSYQMGSDGVISGSASLLPRVEKEMAELYWAGKLDEARDMFYSKVLPLLNHCMFDPHAYSACKYVLKWLGIFRSTTVRRPFAEPINEVQQDELRYVVQRIGLLK